MVIIESLLNVRSVIKTFCVLYKATLLMTMLYKLRFPTPAFTRSVLSFNKINSLLTPITFDISLTLTLQEAVLLPPKIFAVMVAVPLPTAKIIPLVTVATESLLVAQVIDVEDCVPVTCKVSAYPKNKVKLDLLRDKAGTVDGLGDLLLSFLHPVKITGNVNIAKKRNFFMIKFT